MREVKVFSTQSNDSKTINTAATTYGQLKADLGTFKTDGMKAVIRESKNTLESDDAVLPTGPFSLYLMPTKVKSGL